MKYYPSDNWQLYGKSALRLPGSALMALLILVVFATGYDSYNPQIDPVPPDHACRFWGIVGSAFQDSILTDQLISGTNTLKDLGDDNPDGWGLAFFAQALMDTGWEDPILLRAGPKINHDSDDRFSTSVASMLALSPGTALVHVRKATAGYPNIPDPHPFLRDEITLAHNGTFRTSALESLLTVDDPSYLDIHPPDYQEPYIDSELFLLYILKLRDMGVPQGACGRSFSLCDAIREATYRAYDVSAIETAANCLIMVPDTLFAVRFDIDTLPRYEVKYLELPGAWIVASEPVGTNTSGWVSLPPKNLGVFTGNAEPEISSILPPTAYLSISSITIDDDLNGDSAGNSDADSDAGEQIELILGLHNEGGYNAYNVRATLTTEDTLCVITDGFEEFGDIASDQIAVCFEDFDLGIDPGSPDGCQIAFTLMIEADNRPTWVREFVLGVDAPVIEMEMFLVDDSGGDGGIDPGETFTLTTTFANTGGENATNLQFDLTINHPFITLIQATATLDTLLAGEVAAPLPPFELFLSAECPDQDLLIAELAITADWQQNAAISFYLPVGGLADDMESGPGAWTHAIVTPGFADQWHHSLENNHTQGGLWSWKFGSSSGGSYENFSDGALISEQVPLQNYTCLRFWHWMEAETSGTYPGYCFDGGMVEMSVNLGPWIQIHPVGGYPYLIRPGSVPGPWPAETEVYSGEINWAEAIFEITGLEGQARFRFRFGSDGSVVREGWFIDDVEIFGSDTELAGINEPNSLRIRPGIDQIHPNPFASSTSITWRLPRSQDFLLQIFDPAGRLVRTLARGQGQAGTHRIQWDGNDLAGTRSSSGVYLCRFKSGKIVQTRKMILAR